MKRILLLQRQPPGPCSREALDAALVAGVFEQSVSVLFRDAGVRQLVASEENVSSGVLDLVKSLPEYGIEALFACPDSLDQHGFLPADLIMSVRILSREEQRALIAQQDSVIND